jgi:hypothetical protein
MLTINSKFKIFFNRLDLASFRIEFVAKIVHLTYVCKVIIVEAYKFFLDWTWKYCKKKPKFAAQI